MTGAAVVGDLSPLVRFLGFLAVAALVGLLIWGLGSAWERWRRHRGAESWRRAANAAALQAEELGAPPETTRAWLAALERARRGRAR